MQTSKVVKATVHTLQ